MRRTLVLVAVASGLATGITVAGVAAAPRHVLAVPWSGTLDGSGVVDGTAAKGQVCSANWSGKLQFDVAGTTLSGSGSVDITNQACSVKLPTPFIQHVEYTVSGTRSSEKNGDTQFTLFFHGQSISPPGYDPSGFLLHFGQTNEGIPLALTATGGRIDQKLSNSAQLSNATLTVNDHFVLRSNCDPGLLDKADKEYEQAHGYDETGMEKLEESEKDATRTIVGYGAEFSGEFAAEQAIAFGVKKLGSEGLFLVVEVGGTVFTLGKIVYDIASDLIPDYVDSRTAFNDASKQFAKADGTTKRADADLAAALDQGPCIGTAEDEANRLAKEQRLEEQVHKLAESWRAAGSNSLYVVNGELRDERSALAAARASLTGGGRSSQVVSAGPPSVKANLKQLEAALADMKRALTDHAKAKPKLALYKQKTTAIGARIKALLAGWR